MQSTIDMLNFWQDSKLAKEQGSTLDHPYNLGFKRNFQVTASSTVFCLPGFTGFINACRLGCVPCTIINLCYGTYWQLT